LVTTLHRALDQREHLTIAINASAIKVLCDSIAKGSKECGDGRLLRPPFIKDFLVRGPHTYRGRSQQTSKLFTARHHRPPRALLISLMTFSAAARSPGRAVGLLESQRSSDRILPAAF